VYAKLGELPRAEAVFQEMRASGVTPLTGAYNIRLNGYGRMRDFEAMESFFAEMQVSGVALDEVRRSVMMCWRDKAPISRWNSTWIVCTIYLHTGGRAGKGP
jgi:pentatricopeptide repeat protein